LVRISVRITTYFGVYVTTHQSAATPTVEVSENGNIESSWSGGRQDVAPELLDEVFHICDNVPDDVQQPWESTW